MALEPNPTIGLERAWRALMMLLGKKSSNQASANKIILKTLRSQQGRR